MSFIPLITRHIDHAGNPGDLFIVLGLQYLLSQAIENPQFLLIDKFIPSDFEKYKEEIKQAGQIIYAGTPQYNNLDDWCLWYDQGMFQQFIYPWKLKFHSIAGGSGAIGTAMTPADFSKHCLSSERTVKALRAKQAITKLCTVRDRHAFKLLQDINQPVSLLPCTALWSSQWLGIVPTKSNIVGLVPPAINHVEPKLIGGKTHDDVTRWFKQFFLNLSIELSQRGYSSIVICHGLKDYNAYKTLSNCWYSNDPTTLMKRYSTLHGVISTRLHGAIPVAGMNKHSVLIGIDTRNSAADVIDIPKLLLGKDKFDIKSVVDLYLNSKSDYSNIMTSSQNRYTELFSEHCI